MSFYKPTCKGCTKRYVGCHADCEDYLSAKREGDAKKELMREYKKRNNEIYAFRQEGIRKALRRG